MYLDVFFYCIIIVYKEKEILNKQSNPIPQALEFEKRQKKKAIIVGLKYSLNDYYVKKKQREEKNNWAEGWVIFARDGKLSDSFHSSWFLPTIYHRTIRQMTNEITQWDQAGKPKRK